MSIINPNVQLSRLEIAPVWAKLERLDSKGVYNFLVNPEEVAWSHQAEFSNLAVLGTAQPLSSYKSSGSALSLPSVHFWTPNHAGDLTATLEALKAMTKPVAPGQAPPILKLTWGHLLEPRLYLRKLDIKEKQWRSGKVTQAEGSMEFLLAPVPPKAQIVKVDLKLSDRERSDYQNKVKDKLKTDKNLAKKLGVTDAAAITVDADGKVTAKDAKGSTKQLGTVKDLLGNVKSGHKDIGKK